MIRCSARVFITLAAFLLPCGTLFPQTTRTLENGRLKVEIEPKGFVIRVTDKSSAAVYKTERIGSVTFEGESCSGDTCRFRYRVFPGDFPLAVSLTLRDDTIIFGLHADPEQEMTGPVRFPGPIPSNENDFYIIPHAAGIINTVREDYPLGNPRGKYFMWGYKATMPFAGVTDLEKGYMIISDDPWDTAVDILRPDWSQPFHTLQLEHHPSKGKFGYDRTFFFTFVDHGGYVEMCRRYRNHAESLGYVRTLREKALDNPNVDRLIGAVDFWAFAQFRNEDFIDTLLDYGFDRLEIVFPMNYVNPESLPGLIEYINGRGLLSSRYDCFTDVYPPTHPDNPNFRIEGYPEDVIVNADGSLCRGWVTYLDDGTAFQGYHTCSLTHERYASDTLSEELAREPYNARFIDVELASHLYECYSPLHPATRRDDAVHRTRTLKVVKEDFGLVVGSEEAMDFAFPHVDYGMGTMSIVAPEGAAYDWVHPIDKPGEMFVRYSMNPAFRVPLHGLVYHDTHVATWYTGDGVSKVPGYWDDKDLFTILYGTMQVFMPPGMNYWNLNIEKFITSYHLTSSVFRRVGYERMTDHEFLSRGGAVQKTEYSNGWTVVVNFGAEDYRYEGKTIPPKGFHAGSGSERVFRIREDGNVYAGVKLSDRLFLNPYGRLVEFEGIRSTGPVFLRKHDDHMSLALVGNLRSIDINPAELPWPVEGIHVRTKHTGLPVELTGIGGGWLKLERPQGERFFKIEWDRESTSVKETSCDEPEKPVLSVFPNPANNYVTIRFTVPADGRATVEIFNVLGQKVKTVRDGRLTRGTYSVTLNGGLPASGLYFCRLSVGNRRLVRRLTVVK